MIDYSLNITFTHTGKPKIKMICLIAIIFLLQLSGTKPELSPRSACVIVSLPRVTRPSPPLWLTKGRCFKAGKFVRWFMFYRALDLCMGPRMYLTGTTYHFPIPFSSLPYKLTLKSTLLINHIQLNLHLRLCF